MPACVYVPLPKSEIALYLGMIDCGKRIAFEEGWRVFWRGWFISFLIYLAYDPLFDWREKVYSLLGRLFGW